MHGADAAVVWYNTNSNAVRTHGYISAHTHGGRVAQSSAARAGDDETGKTLEFVSWGLLATHTNITRAPDQASTRSTDYVGVRKCVVRCTRSQSGTRTHRPCRGRQLVLRAACLLNLYTCMSRKQQHAMPARFGTNQPTSVMGWTTAVAVVCAHRRVGKARRDSVVWRPHPPPPNQPAGQVASQATN